jgi:hypothetical protein
MVNLYQFKNSGMGAEGLDRCALQCIHQKDVSTRHGCTSQVLRFTLR